MLQSSPFFLLHSIPVVVVGIKGPIDCFQIWKLYTCKLLLCHSIESKETQTVSDFYQLKFVMSSMEVWIKTGSFNNGKSPWGRIYWHLYRHFKVQMQLPHVRHFQLSCNSSFWWGVKMKKYQKKGSRTTGSINIWMCCITWIARNKWECNY